MDTELDTAATGTAQHEWVAVSIQPIFVLPDEHGRPLAFSDPDQPGETQYGCNFCSEPLETNFNTPCRGED